LWRDRVDGISIVVSKWAEDAMVDPEVLGGLFSKTRMFMIGLSKRRVSGEEESKEIYVTEMESKV